MAGHHIPEQWPECAITDDGRHRMRFDGDDPYVICMACDERRDALTGALVTKGRR